MFDVKNSKWFAYVGFVVVFAALGAAQLGYLTEQIALFVGGIFGIIGVAGLRVWLEVQGWKTYFLAGVGVVVLVLYATNVLVVEQVKIVFMFLASLAGITLNQAVTKST